MTESIPDYSKWYITKQSKIYILIFTFNVKTQKVHKMSKLIVF